MNHWAQAARGAHFFWFPIPAYAMLPFMLWIFIQTWWMFLFAVVVCLMLSVLKMRGRSVSWVIRRVHCRIRGGRVYARTIFYRRRVNLRLNLEEFVN